MMVFQMIGKMNNGLNPNDSSDAIQLKNGYTNIEVYANSLVENKINLSTKDIKEKIKYVDTLNSREYTTGSLESSYGCC